MAGSLLNKRQALGGPGKLPAGHHVRHLTESPTTGGILELFFCFSFLLRFKKVGGMLTWIHCLGASSLEGTGLGCGQEWKTRQEGLWFCPVSWFPSVFPFSICFILFLCRRVHFRIFPASHKVLFNGREGFSLFAFETRQGALNPKAETDHTSTSSRGDLLTGAVETSDYRPQHLIFGAMFAEFNLFNHWLYLRWISELSRTNKLFLRRLFSPDSSFCSPKDIGPSWRTGHIIRN